MNEKGYCWASDDYFSNQYEVSKTIIQNWLKSLENKGYISRTVTYKEGTLSRYIRILEGGTQENLRDNNTSFNTTINNTKDIKRLRDNLLDDYPNEMKKAKLDKWDDVFRPMEEKDGATIEQIEYVIQWLGKGCF